MKWVFTMKIISPEFEYTGWEIAPECLVHIQEILSCVLIEKMIGSPSPIKLDIVEFGSGKSTEVIYKFKEENNIPGVFDSFDADPNYAHPIAKIRDIKSYDGRPIQFGDDYSFYDIMEGDLTSSDYNLVILDGHHGHGRSAAWELLIGKLAKGCVVVIDDFDHYPFKEDFLKVFPDSVLLDNHWRSEEHTSELQSH